jgi:transposase
MAPATSLARLRKRVLDLVETGDLSVVEACHRLGISRSRYYELRTRYQAYGEAGLLPKPRPPARPDRRVSPALVDQIIAYAIHHPTEGPRSIAARLGLPRFGSWRVSHGGVYNVLRRAGLGADLRSPRRRGGPGRGRGRPDHRAGAQGAPGPGGHPSPHRLRSSR